MQNAIAPSSTPFYSHRRSKIDIVSHSTCALCSMQIKIYSSEEQCLLFENISKNSGTLTSLSIRNSNRKGNEKAWLSTSTERNVGILKPNRHWAQWMLQMPRFITIKLYSERKNSPNTFTTVLSEIYLNELTHISKCIYNSIVCSVYASHFASHCTYYCASGHHKMV